MHSDDVQLWLDATLNIHPDEPTRKRRRLNQDATRFTPPSTNIVMSLPHGSGSPSKRPRHDDITPRPKRTQTANSRSRPSASSSAVRSSQLSPRKQIRRLEEDDDGLKMLTLRNYADIPPEAQTLLKDIRKFAHYKGLVSKSARKDLLEAAELDVMFDWVSLYDDSLFTDDPDIFSPPSDAVRIISAAASHCHFRGATEVVWNEEVHSKVLSLAFRPSGQIPFKRVVDFVNCTTATIMPEYSSATNKRVDYCIYYDTENDKTLSDDYRATAKRLRLALPDEVLNFTDYEPLKRCFVGLSIETKKPIGSCETGLLQLAVWDMARWKFLQRLAAGVDEDEDIFAAAEQRSARTARLPAFLPSIVVQGDEWSLVLTTMKQHKTVLWHKMLIGTTSNTEGIYQLVRALQHLGQWVANVYWPCIQHMVMEA